MNRSLELATTRMDPQVSHIGVPNNNNNDNNNLSIDQAWHFAPSITCRIFRSSNAVCPSVPSPKKSLNLLCTVSTSGLVAVGGVWVTTAFCKRSFVESVSLRSSTSTSRNRYSTSPNFCCPHFLCAKHESSALHTALSEMEPPEAFDRRKLGRRPRGLGAFCPVR